MSQVAPVTAPVSAPTRRQQLEALASVHLNNPELSAKEVAAKAWFELITDTHAERHQATDILATLLSDATPDRENEHILTTAMALVDKLPVLGATARHLAV